MALDDPARAHLHQQPQISRPASAASNQAGSSMHDPRVAQMGIPAVRQQRPYHIAERVGGQMARDESLLGGPPSPTLVAPNQAGTLPAAYAANGRPGPVATNTYPGDARSSAVNEFGQPVGMAPDALKAFDTAPQPVSAPPATTTSLGRFAVVNGTQRDELDSPRSSALHEPYLTAADERRRLSQQMINPDAAYASIPPLNPPPPSASQPHINGFKLNEPKVESTNNQTGGGSSSQQEKSKWLSAEQEKQRLFESAKAAADLSQRRVVNSSVGGGGGSMSKGNSPRDKQQVLLSVDHHYSDALTPPSSLRKVKSRHSHLPGLFLDTKTKLRLRMFSNSLLSIVLTNVLDPTPRVCLLHQLKNHHLAQEPRNGCPLTRKNASCMRKLRPRP